MPSYDRVGLNDQESGAPARPDPRKPNPEDPIAMSKPRPFQALGQDRELLPKGEVLGSQLGAVSHGDSNQGKKDVQHAPFTGIPGS